MAGSSLSGLRVVVLNWRDLEHSLAGGSERYAWEAAIALREAGAEVEFLTARDTGQRSGGVAEQITVVRRGGRFSYYPRALARLLWLRLTRRRPDLVIDPANGIPVFAPLVLSRRTPVVLLMHHVHQQQFVTYFPAPLARLGQFLEGPAMRRVYQGRTTLVVSASTDTEMRRQLGWTEPTLLVPNGNVLPDLTGLDLAAVKAEGEVRRLVIFGRMAVHKRVGLSLRAFAQVRRELAGTLGDLRMDVVGTGPNESEIKALVTELGLDEVVAVHGFVAEEEKRRILTGAWINLCASDAEGWGQVVVEAAAYGVPTLARDVPGLRDSILPGRTGWLVADVPGGDPGRIVALLAAGLTEALEEMESAKRAEQIRTACLDWAGAYSWPRMHQRIVHVACTELGRPRAAEMSPAVLDGSGRA